MLGKRAPGKRAPTSGDPSGNARFLNEIEALGKALSLDAKSHRRRLPDPNPNPKPSSSNVNKPKKPSSSSSSSSSSSFWKWKPLRALSHIGRQRFECVFSLHIHSIESLPTALTGADITVGWRRTADPPASAERTRPARALHGVVEFEETLAHRCTVYGSRGSGSHGAAKYEPRHFLVHAEVNGALGIELGRHLVDLTRILPMTLEELSEEGKSSGAWSTSFKLSGKARGASLNVSFGFALVGDGARGSSEALGDNEKKVVEILNDRVGRMDRDDRQSSIGSARRIMGHERNLPSSRSVEDVRVLHEVLPTSRSDVLGIVEFARELEGGQDDDSTIGGGEVNNPKPESEAFDLDLPGSPELKACTELEPAKGEKDGDEPEFMVVEQGVELAPKFAILEPLLQKVEPEPEREGVIVEDKDGKLDQHEVDVKPAQLAKKLPDSDGDRKENCLLPEDQAFEDLDTIFNSAGLESLMAEEKTPKRLSYSAVKSNYKAGSMKSKSLSLDDECVASEFLSMLGIEHSPFGLSSDSDPESPKERLWKQFEKESLGKNDSLFALEIGAGKESYWADSSMDLDLTSIVHEAETELKKATQVVDSKSRAKMMEDAETEALMRQWGLDEKAFQCSPPGSRSGFGSPIDLPPEDPVELPPLGDGLGSFIQTNDGGFLRSMSPSLFGNAKNNGSLIMQVSSPVVVPAEMGSGIMEILQRLAAVGIEKLSMQASGLMPLEDITGKTMQQVAWEATPALEGCERQDLLQNFKPDMDIGVGQNPSGRRKKGKGLDLASSASNIGSEYVSLEDLAPLAMDKIEALSIEGLRIQSGMSDEEAPSNISAQSVGDISALEGKGAKNSRSLGLEGTAGLQLLDVKDSGDDVDGLMGLSITLDEWMRLDSGIVDEEDHISDRTSKILAAHHASSTELVGGGWKGDKRGGKSSGRRWGLLGNNFTVALMVQLRDPLRNYEPVGAPMLSLIQVERVFVPPKPKIYGTVSLTGNSEQDDEPETKTTLPAKEEGREEEEVIPQFKITEVHVAGLKTESGKKNPWGDPMQQQSGSRWLLASGMGKSNKHPFMKSKAPTKPSQVTTKVQPGDTLWSISSRVHGTGAKWKELAALNPHIRNPNVILPNETIRLS